MFFDWLKNKVKDETGGGVLSFVGAAVGIGLAIATGGAALALMPLGVFGTIAAAGVVGGAIGYAVEEVVMPLFVPEIPEFSISPTYADKTGRIGNTISEGVFVSRCYGKPKIGGNKIRFNDKDATDLRIIVAHCMGEVEGITRWEINDIEWSELTGSHTKTEYKGTRTQTVNGRFSDRASAYRSIAYTAFTFEKDDKQVGYNPNITVVMEGLKCLPLAGGPIAKTRNPAVILYDWYLNVEGYSAGDLDLNAWKSLEELCDEVPSGSSLPRYRFDLNIDVNIAINDAKKLIWSSFNGRTLMSQGKIKPIWDSGQMANGSGSLTAKTVSHAFDMDNIAKDSFTWSQLERPNIVRIHFKDSAKNYKNSSVELKDEADIAVNGEILYEEKCWYITDAEIARRRCRLKYNRRRYADYGAKFTALSGAGDIEVLDLVTITHTLPGWTTKQFLIMSRGEDEVGRMRFTVEAYYSGAYDDAQVGTQAGYESDLPNPYQVPAASTGISSAMTAVGTAYDFDAVRVTFTPPATDPFYSYSEIYASKDDSTYYYVGRDGTGTFTFSALGVIYEPGDTCYIKIRSVSEYGVPENLPAAASTSVLISSTMRLGGFYAGLTFFGDNETPADAKILLDKTNTLIRVGPTSADYITIDGDYSGVPAIVTSNYVSGYMGAGLLLKSDLLEVGNIACRGIFRTNVFQKDTISVIGGNALIMAGDVLDTDMTAADNSTLKIEGNETFAVGDFLRIKDGNDDEWLEVTNIASAPTYTVTRDKKSDYAANSNPAWTKGAAVVSYGASGKGGLYMTASETNAPYMSVITHAGSPWDTITTHIRMGNLNGYAGYTSDIYGWAAYIDADNYIKIDPTDGIRMSGGNIKILAGGDIAFYSESLNPSKLTFTGDTRTITIGTDFHRDQLCFYPDTAGEGYFRIGSNLYDVTTRFYSIELNARHHIELRALDGAANAGIFLGAYDGGFVRFSVANYIAPLNNKTTDFGTTGKAWDDAYADDWHNVADFFNFDIYDDLVAINGIKGSGIIDERTGHELIDDNTLPLWLLSKYKQNGILYEKGDIMYDSDGKPYLSLKACISLCWGAIRQLDKKIGAINAKFN